VSRRGDPGAYERIRTVVKLVPSGRVATYGQIAAIAGRATPRMVGYCLASLPPGSGVPWHRIINARGAVSLRDDHGGVEQRRMLESEGIEFESDRVDLERFGWRGPGDRRDGAT